MWTGFTGSITPLRRPRKVAEASVAPGASADVAAVVPPDRVRRDTPAGKKSPPLAPLGRRLKQRVASGREPIDARIDLHGKTQKEAHAALLRFLLRAQGEGAKIVLVVTGKGTRVASGDREQSGAAERGVLRRQVPIWLSLPEFRALVVGFEDAHIGHGGEGALYVRLRRGR